MHQGSDYHSDWTPKVNLSSSDRTPHIKFRGEPASRLLSNCTKITLYPLSVEQLH